MLQVTAKLSWVLTTAQPLASKPGRTEVVQRSQIILLMTLVTAACFSHDVSCRLFVSLLCMKVFPFLWAKCATGSCNPPSFFSVSGFKNLMLSVILSTAELVSAGHQAGEWTINILHV